MSDNPYTTGEASWRCRPRIDTKPATILREHRRDGEPTVRHDTGGGYERFRSYEYRPHTAREGKEDVYVAHHRLLAVVACYPDDMPVGEILAHLHGKDVHHQSGVEWDNRPDTLVVREHSRHSAITQDQMRAWAADAKRVAERIRRGEHDEDRCDRCEEPADTLAESPEWPGTLCLDCAMAVGSDAPIEVG